MINLYEICLQGQPAMQYAGYGGYGIPSRGSSKGHSNSTGTGVRLVWITYRDTNRKMYSHIFVRDCALQNSIGVGGIKLE